MTKRSFDRDVERVARRQFGVVNRAQVEGLGGTDSMCSDRVLRGDWVRLARGVYALSSAPATWQRQYKAAELSKARSSLFRRSAALVHGVEGARVLRPELVVPAGTSTRSALATVARSSRELPTVLIAGLRVTTLAQTLCDLLAVVPLSFVERALDGALLARRVTLDECTERLEALSGARHLPLAQLAALIEQRSGEGWAPPESELEATLGTLLGRLPVSVSIVRQGSLPWRKEGSGRVDFLVEQWKLILEADGRRWHARVADFDRDRWRDNEAQAHGYRVLRFTHAHLTQRPDEVLSLVVAASSWRTVAA